jgi:hypothetical protein
LANEKNVLSPDALRSARWRAANKDKVKEYKKKYRSKPDYPHVVRCERLKRNYGITHEQYEKLLENQEGRCAICRTTEPGGNRHSSHFHVDHDHQTGEIRGLLCCECNRGLGILGDNLENLERVISYLTRTKEKVDAENPAI